MKQSGSLGRLLMVVESAGAVLIQEEFVSIRHLSSSEQKI